MQMVNINIPFPGFYNSLYSNEIDNAAERDGEYMEERESDKQYYPDDWQPEMVRLNACDYADIFFDCTDYSAAHLDIAKDYVCAFDKWCADNLGTPSGSFQFEAMTSPREYNFQTDRLFADVPFAVMQKLFEMSAANDHAALAETIKDRFTSYDGFISHYSNRLADWLDKPLDEWDHNELATLLGAVMTLADDWNDSDSWQWEMYDRTMGDDCGYTAFSNAVDWDKFESLVQDARIEKIESAIDDDAETAIAEIMRHEQTRELIGDGAAFSPDAETAIAEWHRSHYRCSHTLELDLGE